MNPADARARFAAGRVARLATAGAAGAPHVVAVCFALDEDRVYSAVDHKPKRTRSLRRLANVAENPAVSLLVDHYEDEDWRRLWWARADGTARVLDAAEPEGARALDLLAARYAPYRERRPEGPVLVVDVARWSGWSAAG